MSFAESAENVKKIFEEEVGLGDQESPKNLSSSELWTFILQLYLFLLLTHLLSKYLLSIDYGSNSVSSAEDKKVNKIKDDFFLVECRDTVIN